MRVMDRFALERHFLASKLLSKRCSDETTLTDFFLFVSSLLVQLGEFRESDLERVNLRKKVQDRNTKMFLCEAKTRRAENRN